MTRAAAASFRVLWWCGVPMLTIAWFLTSGRTGIARPDVLYDLGNALWAFSPLAAELLVEYAFTLLTLAGVIATTLWGARRGLALVRIESLALPTFVAGLESCTRLAWFLACRNSSRPPTMAELHSELHTGAAASIVAMGFPLLVAAVLLLCYRRGISGSLTRAPFLSAIAVMTSICIIWRLYDFVIAG